MCLFAQAKQEEEEKERLLVEEAKREVLARESFSPEAAKSIIKVKSAIYKKEIEKESQFYNFYYIAYSTIICALVCR